jgi:hypothetical protein
MTMLFSLFDHHRYRIRKAVTSNPGRASFTYAFTTSKKRHQRVIDKVLAIVHDYGLLGTLTKSTPRGKNHWENVVVMTLDDTAAPGTLGQRACEERDTLDLAAFRYGNLLDGFERSVRNGSWVFTVHEDDVVDKRVVDRAFTFMKDAGYCPTWVGNGYVVLDMPPDEMERVLIAVLRDAGFHV